MNAVTLIDQSIGDGQRSLWGLRMTTEMMLPIAPVIDRVGFRAAGVVGGRAAVLMIRQVK